MVSRQEPFHHKHDATFLFITFITSLLLLILHLLLSLLAQSLDCLLRSLLAFTRSLIHGSSMASTRAQVPLHCSICPKRPNFSDVSHMLTHISSKSHLSHYYKIKIRAAADQDARDQVNQYDSWYDRFDVETLMAERLALKDEKKVKKQSTQGLLQIAP